MLMGPRRREDPPKEEKPQEETPEWQGELFIENHEKKMRRIASVICHPTPPVPLPIRVQLSKEFIKMRDAMYQVYIGLPFFELHKANYKYSPKSEWTNFLNFMLENQRLATILCQGWKLYLQPPQKDPPHGFRSVRVHYERSFEDPMTVAEDPMAVEKDPSTEPVVHGSDGNGMEMDLQDVQIHDTSSLMCDQRPRREVEFHAPSSSSRESVSKGDDAITVFNERRPGFHGNECKFERTGALITLKHKVVSEMREKAARMDLVNHKDTTSGAAPATEERMGDYLAEPAVEPTGSAQRRVKKRMISVSPKSGAQQSRGRLVKNYSKTVLAEKLEDGGQKADAPIPAAFLTGDFMIEKGVVGKGKGRMSIKRKVPSDGSIMKKASSSGSSTKKTSSNKSIMKKRSSNESVRKHIVHALPRVPEQFRVNVSSGGASSKEEMLRGVECCKDV